MKQHSILFAVLTLAFLLIISGCGGADSTKDGASSEPAIKHYDNLPTGFTYIVPYDDIRNDGDELGDYRMVDGEFSKDITKQSYCSDKETIAEIYALIDTDDMQAKGQMTDEQVNEYFEANYGTLAIHFVFDKQYYVTVHQDNTVVTQTFYTEGEKYEQLANAYYEESGVYPPIISDSLWQYTAADGTYSKLSEILLALPEEQEPGEN